MASTKKRKEGMLALFVLSLANPPTSTSCLPTPSPLAPPPPPPRLASRRSKGTQEEEKEGQEDRSPQD